MSLVRLSAEFSARFGARCLDGSPPAFWLRRGESSLFTIFWEGGGWCWSQEQCLGRSKGYLGTSNNLRTTFEAGGLLSSNETRNPGLNKGTAVFVHYCDGSSGTSNREEPVDGVWYRGLGVRRAVLAYLLEQEGLAKAENVILSGGSAGALEVYLGLDAMASQIREANRGAKVVGAPDAGFFMDLPTYGNASNYWYRQQFINADQTIWNSTRGGGLPAACLDANRGAEWRCLMAPYVAPMIRTPFFISNSKFDVWQIPNIAKLGCTPPACNSSQIGFLNDYGEKLTSAAVHAATVAPGGVSGAFVVGCWVHEINVDYCSTQPQPNCRGWQSFTVPDGEGARLSLQQAFDAYETGKRGIYADEERYGVNPSCPPA